MTLMKKVIKEQYPYTDQESFPVPVVELLAEYNVSESYELDAGAIFKTINGEYLGVTVSGCS